MPDTDPENEWSQGDGWTPGDAVAEPKPKWEAGDEPNSARMEADERVPPFAASTSNPIAEELEAKQQAPRATGSDRVPVPSALALALADELIKEAGGSWEGSDSKVRAADLIRALVRERDAAG